MYFLGEMWSDDDVGYFLNETFKTVDYHGWLTKKKKIVTGKPRTVSNQIFKAWLFSE